LGAVADEALSGSAECLPQPGGETSSVATETQPTTIILGRLDPDSVVAGRESSRHCSSASQWKVMKWSLPNAADQLRALRPHSSASS
jgi:hypothetical protein